MTLFHAEQNEGLRLYFFSWVPLILLATLLAACLIVSKFSIRIDSLTLSAVLTGPLLTVAGLGLVSSRRLWGWRFGFVMLTGAGHWKLPLGNVRALWTSIRDTVPQRSVDLDQPSGFELIATTCRAQSLARSSACRMSFWSSLESCVGPSLNVSLSILPVNWNGSL